MWVRRKHQKSFKEGGKHTKIPPHIDTAVFRTLHIWCGNLKNWLKPMIKFINVVTNLFLFLLSQFPVSNLSSYVDAIFRSFSTSLAFCYISLHFEDSLLCVRLPIYASSLNLRKAALNHTRSKRTARVAAANFVSLHIIFMNQSFIWRKLKRIKVAAFMFVYKGKYVSEKLEFLLTWNKELKSLYYLLI